MNFPSLTRKSPISLPSLALQATLLSISTLLTPNPAHSQTPILPEYARIVHSEAQLIQSFGMALGISGDTAVVMLQWRSIVDPITYRWGARVLNFNGLNWIEGPLFLTSPTASGAVPGFLRPHAVAIDTNLIAVGELPLVPHILIPGEPDHDAVHLFRFDGVAWSLEEILTPLDNERQDWFGSTIAIQNDLIAIGAPGDSDGPDAQQVGSVYLYRFIGNQWIQEAKIPSPGKVTPGEMFGYSVAIQGSELFVGAPKDLFSTVPGAGGGQVYTFRKFGTEWVHETTIIPSESEDLDRFGTTIAVDGDILAIGAHRDDLGSISDSGSVYVFKNDGKNWLEEAKLIASNGATNDLFGFAVDVLQNTILVGAPGKAIGDQSGLGASYLFHHDGVQWTEQAHSILTNPLQLGSAYFGNSVALSDQRMLVGSSCFDLVIQCPDFDSTSCAGVVNEYARDCNGNGILDLTETANGQADDCNGNFVPDECEDCNANGIADRDDILSGTSTDCNNNCLPDDCELAADCNSLLDCNGNGVIDSCDIASGSSEDLDGNGVPDECTGTVFPDTCSSSTAGATVGTTPISTIAATTDGFPESCGQFESDVWFHAIAIQDCFMTIRLCDVDFPAELAIYDSNCPTGPNQALACSTDSCATNNSITFPAPAFSTHLVRIGGTNGQRGTGNLVITCSSFPPCHGDITPPGGNNTVNIDDLVAVLNAFGPCPPPKTAPCEADLFPISVSVQGDGVVDTLDLITLLNNFGPCP